MTEHKGLRSPRHLMRNAVRRRMPEWWRHKTGGKGNPWENEPPRFSKWQRWMRLLFRRNRLGEHQEAGAALRRREYKLAHWTMMTFAFVVGVIAMVGWNVMSMPPGKINAGMEFLWRLSIILGGLLTAITVLWRGMISVRQTETSRQQVDRMTRQIQATQENNLALMLQKGGEMLGAEEPAKVEAAIATLKAIVVDPSEKYAVEAMDLLADFVQRNGRSGHEGISVRSAIAALAAGAKLSRKSGRTISFQSDDEKCVWTLVSGVFQCEYSGGKIGANSYRHELATYYIFEKTTFYNDFIFAEADMVIIGMRNKFIRCKFLNCHFRAIPANLLSENEFGDCNFSWCAIVGGLDEINSIDLRAGRNFYRDNKPPVLCPGGKVSEDQPHWGNIFRKVKGVA
ncbi:hypothetical protein E3C22_18075 [Jiella endophytica]|uniref:Pentapeptide repeat-containing protein n=1 Tax=Jiella endophytica TaxID=2558362 RepID=A0A4Y8RGU6_9HYPH|nr:hypothetical protein [Jiella endophytica]TFF20797.1 hypothetical protein E3C22_18075 [Jiella endophytica]